MEWRWLGTIGHADAVATMESLRDRVLGGEVRAQAVLLAEHPPVITLGRNADAGHIVATAAALAASGVEVVAASRGGDVTYHGPGQLMIYPVVRVRAGVVAFLERIAAVLAEAAAELGVPGVEFRRDPAGLWLGDAKLAACGLHLRRQVAIHGWALNLSTPPARWQLIVPCGLPTPVISLDEARAARGLAPTPPIADIAALLGPRLAAALSEPASTGRGEPPSSPVR